MAKRKPDDVSAAPHDETIVIPANETPAPLSIDPPVEANGTVRKPGQPAAPTDGSERKKVIYASYVCIARNRNSGVLEVLHIAKNRVRFYRWYDAVRPMLIANYADLLVIKGRDVTQTSLLS